jgi:modulator of FtsH protease
MTQLVLGSWRTFFSTQAGVAAALTGLVFVALSINLKQILGSPGLAGRAGEALLLLLLPVLVGLAGVLPQTGVRPFGAELLGLGLVDWAAVTAIVITGRKAAASRPLPEFASRAVVAEVAVIPTVVAGAILLAGHTGGLWWQAVGTGLCIAAGVGDGWVLLVEILR